MSDVLTLWNQAPNPDELAKALDEQKRTNSEIILPKSAIVDPLNGETYGGTRSKPTAVPYTTLRRMAQIPAIAAVINTRLNQVASHSRRPRFSGDTGFRIGLKDREEKMNDKQKKRAKEIEDFFLKTGWEKNKVRKDNFNTFLRKITRDTLTIDAMTFEKVNKFKGEVKGRMDVAEIWAIDATTIELALNNPVGEGLNYEPPVYKPVTKTGKQNIGDIAYVQKVNGTIVAEYTEDELAFAIRNPRTDLFYTDFGMSELETLMEIVTGIVNGVRYNTSYFTHSHLPQGVMSLIGKYKDEHLKAFQRHWKVLTEGAAGKWSVPVMALEDGQGFNWTPFKNSNRDMEFNQFLEFLFNVACAVYQIDPNEVGFKSWTSNTGGMSQSDNTDAKMEQSKDKGFNPLMDFLSDTFNSEIVDMIDDQYEFQWVGVDDEDEDRKLERQEKELTMGTKTVSMIWAENDTDLTELTAQNGGKIPDWAYAPGSPQLIQVYMADVQQQQAQQQAQQQGDMQAQQADQDHKNTLAQNDQQQQFQQQTSDDQHKKQLEIMDKQHGNDLKQTAMNNLHQRSQMATQHNNNMQVKKADFEHQKNMAKMTAGHTMEAKKADHQQQTKITQMTAQQKAQEAKKKLKKSIEDQFKKAGFDVDWSDY